ncbi:MAG: hypothetical protein PHP92_04135 [Candidatus Nanoarchaeia archaeon]|nr:hypothetical protein [Candidatus Nanoarchaeia archaeon]
MKLKVETIKLNNGDDVISVAEFNEKCSHIIIDDHCWNIINGDKFSSYIFPEAMSILKKLPDSPDKYKPYIKYLKQRSKE